MKLSEIKKRLHRGTPLLFLFVIILLGFFLRMQNLSRVPYGFFADEASIGYNAYSIAATGKDEYSRQFPFFFEAFGEYKNPVQIYATVPFVALFGLNEAVVRSVSVLFGICSIIALYLLTKTLLKDHPYRRTTALFAALFLAISPWHIHMSRVALEGLMAYLFFTLLGLYFFLRAKERWGIFFCILFFSLAVYSYFPARIFIPLFFLAVILIYRKQIVFSRRNIILSVIAIIITSLPLVDSLLNQSALKRWEQVSIFSTDDTPYNIAQQMITNYLTHFSLDFLFMEGDIGMPGQMLTRHSIKNFGELYLFQLPLLIIGIYGLLKCKDKRIACILFTWLTLYPLGSAITLDSSPQATRSLIGVLPFQIMTAIGVVTLFGFFKQNNYAKIGIMTVIMFSSILSLVLFIRSYLTFYTLYSSDFWGWQAGPREITGYFLKHKGEYDDLFMSGEFNGGYIFLKFYDPTNECLGKCKLGDFLREPQIHNPSRRQLFSLSPEYLEKSSFARNFQTLENVYYPNGTVAFKIGVIVQ